MSYNSVDAPYAGIAARQDSQERVASDAARRIQVELAAGWRATRPADRAMLLKRGTPTASSRAPAARGAALIVYGPTAARSASAPTASPKAATNADEAFDLARLTKSDIDADPARLEGELAAVSMLGGRRLVRLRLAGDKPGGPQDRRGGARRHLEGRLNPEAMLLIEAGDLRPGSGLLKIAEKSDGCVGLVC